MTKLFTNTDLPQSMRNGPLGSIIPVYATLLAQQSFSEHSAHLQLRFFNDMNQWLHQQQLQAVGSRHLRQRDGSRGQRQELDQFRPDPLRRHRVDQRRGHRRVRRSGHAFHTDLENNPRQTVTPERCPA